MFLSKDIVLQAYKKGLFPMSDSHEDPYIFWVNPEQRGIIHLNNFKISKSLKKFIRKYNYSIKLNENFSDVIKLCARNKYRNSTWINNQIIDSYTKLSNTGKAISIEYFEEKKMLGGLYGVILGEIFCGESMFSLKKMLVKFASPILLHILLIVGLKLLILSFILII